MTFTTTSLLGSLLKIENLMRCDICHGLIRNARTLNECGHRFCFDCVYHRLGSERKCPTCKLPAIVKNMRPDPMHDTLVACVQKLKIKVAPPMPSFDEHTFSGVGSNSLLLTATTSVHDTTVAGTESHAGLGSSSACQKLTSTSADPKGSGNTAHDAHPITTPVTTESLPRQQVPPSTISPVPSPHHRHHNTFSSLDMSDDIYGLLFNEELPNDERSRQKHGAHSPAAAAAAAPPESSDTGNRPPTSFNSMDTITDIEELFQDSELPDDEKTQRLKPAAIHRLDEDTEKVSSTRGDSEPSSKRLRTIISSSLSSPAPAPVAPSSYDTQLPSCQDDQQQPVAGIPPSDWTTCLSHNKNAADEQDDDDDERPLLTTPATVTSLTTASSMVAQVPPPLSLHPNEHLATLQQDRSLDPSISFSASSTPSLIHIMFTSMSEHELEECVDFAVASGLHMQIYLDMKQFDQVTHLVTSKDDMGLSPRTEKYLRAILAGIWVVDKTWITESCRAGRWLSEEAFEVLGDTVVGRTFGPRRGRLGQHQDLLFEGLRFSFFGKRYPNRELIMLLCRAAGGHILSRRPPPGPSQRRNKDGGQEVCYDHDLENDVIDPEQPIVIIDDEKQLGTKEGKHLAHYQVRALSWMLNCISRFQHPVRKISACTN